MSEASEITRRAKSNLAFALRILPKDRRADMISFYAYCRTLDDLADDPSLPLEQRARAIADWKHGLLHGFPNPSPLQQEILSLRERHHIPTEHLTAIADGCAADLSPRRFQSWPDLDAYIWQVACAVGLVSIRLFGCSHPDSPAYAEALGRALQLTNILRDVGEDIDNGGRIYLPLDDLHQAGLDETTLLRKPTDPRFQELMKLTASRARRFYQDAEAILPAADRKALAPARIMAEIYQKLLADMSADGFRVFSKRYRVSRPRKLFILFKHLVAG